MYRVIILIALGLLSTNLIGQKERKVSFVGAARATMNSNELVVRDTIRDTTTVKKISGGYTLVDLGVNIRPNKNTEIMGMFRIRNGYGGFWGSNVNFDVRQLWVKGVVANALRYQVGDLNLKQTPFTLYNHHADQIDSLPSIFKLQNDIISYERFYQNNNSWRMQGANVDFGFTFAKYLKEINLNGFITRLNATNFGNIADRLMSGANLEFVLNDFIKFGLNHNSVFDVSGTIKSDNVFSSSVNTLDWTLQKNIGESNLIFSGEVGKSSHGYSNDILAPKLNDYFIHVNTAFNLNKTGLSMILGYLNVGPDFRSIGAQSKDVNYNAEPIYFNRYTNPQNIRPISLFDMIGNVNIYNRTVSSSLPAENQVFNTIMPFGLSTFNRIGVYGRLHYTSKDGIALNSEYYNLSEIRGQGSKSLKNFASLKLNATLPLHHLLKSKKKVIVQAGTNMQASTRNSTESIENVDFNNLQYNVGLNLEIIENFELLLGIINNNSEGFNFKPDRNNYGEIIYYNQVKSNLKQSMKAIGFRYNFNPKTYISAIYQQATYEDIQKDNANFNISQYGIIYNITL